MVMGIEVAAIVSAYRPDVDQLERQLRSLRDQDGVDVQPYILEVGTDDPSLWSLPADVDVGERHWCRQRINLPMAWNYLCMVASQRWAVIANVDDWWEPNGITRLLYLAQGLGTSFAYGDVRCHHGDRVYDGVTKPHSSESIRETVDIGPCVLFDRERLLGLGGFDTSLEIACDWDAWIRLSIDGIAYTGDVVGNFTIRESSLSHSNRASRDHEFMRVRRRHRHG